jgi:excisionase family DNA binding protein
MSEEFTIAECAAKAKVSARTIRREIADGKIRFSKVRGCIRITAEAWEEYRRQCQYVATAEDTKPAFNMPADDLAALLGLTGTPRNGKRATATGSRIVELAAHRATRSRKPSTVG